VPWVPLDDDDFPTLGWAVLEHGERYLVFPDGERAGQPWEWTDDQKRHVLQAYRLDPLTGQRVNRRTMLVRPKKWGKGPFAAALALCEATGPCRFAGWDDQGQPIAVRVWGARREFGGGWIPLVQVCGTSEAQTTNIWAPLRRMLKRLHECGLTIDDGQTRVLIDPDGMRGIIEPVTASALSREGQPVTFAACDETWQWVKSNQGLSLIGAIRRNAGGTSGWTLETTNAPAVGSRSVAENTAEAVQTKGVRDVHLDWPEPPGEPPDPTDRPAILAEIELAYGDHVVAKGGWVVPARQLAEALDPDTAWVDALRFYCNRRSTAAGAWLSREAWMACARPDLQVAPRELITVGFDGSRGASEDADHTALVGCRVSDGHLFVIRHFRPELRVDGAWSIDPIEVEQAVEHAFTTWDVWRLYGDPPYYAAWLAAWSARWHDRVVSTPTDGRLRMSEAFEALHTAVLGRQVTHDGTEAMADHVANAVVVQRGTADAPRQLIAKEFPQSTRKIDLAVTATLAYLARTHAVAEGATSRRRFRYASG